MSLLVVVIIVIFVYRGNSPTNDVIAVCAHAILDLEITLLIQVNFRPFD